MMVLLLTVAHEFISSNDSSFGSWLEGVRTREIVGEQRLTGTIDDDEAALAAYNDKLAALHGLPPSHPRPPNRPIE